VKPPLDGGPSRWRTDVAACVALAIATSLPFAPAILRGDSLFFRDLSLQIFPLRRLILEGLRAGQVRYWNPYLHEGAPLTPLSYPLELLQLLVPHPAGLSALLLLHLPLAAVTLYLLARRVLGLGPGPAAVAGLAYSLGGFSVATINLYFYPHAVAWGPLAILALLTLGDGGSRSYARTAAAAVAVGLLHSTLAAEVVAQVIAMALALSLARRSLSWRFPLAVAWGTALASYVLLPLAAVASGTGRSGGLDTQMVLSNALPPQAIPQLLVASFLGDLTDLTRGLWAGALFTQGFPYVTSLYVGPVVLGFAAAGLVRPSRTTAALALMAVLGLWVATAPWSGAGALVDALPVLRGLRFPVKAMYTVHLALALLAGFGAERLEGRPRAWLGLAGAGAVAAFLAVTFAAWPTSLAARFFAIADPRVAQVVAAHVTRDALVSAAVAAAAAILAWAAARGRLGPRVAWLLLSGLVAADLSRAGAGVNPTVTSSWFQRSPETDALAARIRPGRLVVCPPEESPSFPGILARLPNRHGHAVFAILRDTLSPDFNVEARVALTFARDRPLWAPKERSLGPRDAGCASLAERLPLIHLAAVTHVSSIDPLEVHGLEPLGTTEPSAVSPLQIHLYGVPHPLPRTEVLPRPVAAASREQAEELSLGEGGVVAVEAPPQALLPARGTSRVESEAPGHIDLAVSASGPGVVIVREGFAPGWRGSVGGVEAAVWRAAGRHLAVAVPGGESRVTLTYRPPRARLGAAVTVLALAAAGIAMVGRKRS
jgi:hypothetical protein